MLNLEGDISPDSNRAGANQANAEERVMVETRGAPHRNAGPFAAQK